MKTFKRLMNVVERPRSGNRVANCGWNILMLMIMICCLESNAKNKNKVVTITGTQFTYPLIERWIAEYAKINPGLRFNLIKDQENSDKGDLKVIAHTPEKGEISSNKSTVDVGRFAILPITSGKNPSFSKEFKKGVKLNGLKAIFMKEETDFNSEEGKAKEPEFTVYSKTPQSCVAKVISAYLGSPSEDLKGIFVTGDDMFLITSLLEDSTGVSYSSLGYIYDLKNRNPLSGIKILPIDLNNNGRLDKEEQIYGNLDEVITFLENSSSTSIPTDHVNFVTDDKTLNSEIQDFLSWVKTSGQEFNHQYGFLYNNSAKNIALTQK